MKKIRIIIGVVFLMFIFSLSACAQSVFRRGIQVGATGSEIERITVGATSVTFYAPLYTHVLNPYLAGNGIYLTGQTFSLGGTITNDLTLTNDGSDYYLHIQGAVGGGTPICSRIQIEQGVLSLYGYTGYSYNSSAYAQLSFNGSTATLTHQGVIDGNSLSVSSSGIVVDASLSGRGLTGAAYYGASITGNDYTQKTYVDNAITSISVSKEVDYTTCPYNDTTNITIGSSLTDVAYLIHYVAYQDISGVDYLQSGTIDVLYNSSLQTVAYSSAYMGSDIGMSIEADRDGIDIRLNIIVQDDPILMNNRYFDYKITSKFTQ